jgi:hypothetical protein
MILLTFPLLPARRARDYSLNSYGGSTTPIHLLTSADSIEHGVSMTVTHYLLDAGRCSRTTTWHDYIYWATRKIITNIIDARPHPSINHTQHFNFHYTRHTPYVYYNARSLCPFIHRLEFCARPSGIIRSSFPLFRPENAHKLLRALRSSGSGSESTYFGRAIEGG